MGLAGVLETSAKDGGDSIDDAFFVTIANAVDQAEREKNGQISGPIAA